MNIEDYLVREGIGIEQKHNFAELLKARLTEEQFKEHDPLYKKADSHPMYGPLVFPEMYNLMAKHNVFTEFWQVNLGHIFALTDLIIEKGVKNHDSILDIGCADGMKTVFYALNHPDKYFVGIDQSKGAIKLAKEKAKRYGLDNIEFVPANLYNLSFESESFDSILATQVLHEDYYCVGSCYSMQQYYVFDKQLKSISSVLAPKGIITATLLVGDNGITPIKSAVTEAAKKAGLNINEIITSRHKNGEFERNSMNFILEKQ